MSDYWKWIIDIDKFSKGEIVEKLISELLEGLWELYHKLDFESELDENFYKSLIKKWEAKITKP